MSVSFRKSLSRYCAPHNGDTGSEKGRGRERESAGRRGGGEGRPTPTEEPGEFFSGAGTKGEHHRLATLSQDGVTDKRTVGRVCGIPAGKRERGVCARQRGASERQREGQPPRFVLNARWTVKRSDGSRSAIYCGCRARDTSPRTEGEGENGFLHM